MATHIVPVGPVTTWSHDELGRVTTADGPFELDWSTTYTLDGEVATTLAPDGSTTTNT